MPFTSSKLVQLLRSVGMEEIQVTKTPGALALVASARKFGAKDDFLSSVRLRGVFSELTRAIPVSLAVREVMRLLTLYRRLPESTDILDVGCGDGSFWRAYPGVGRLTLDGVDLDAKELDLARKSGVYRDLWAMDISQRAPGRKYPFVVGNCSLEHVPHIHRALVNIRESLLEEGRLILFVPAFGWSRSLGAVKTLAKFSNRMAMAASGALDGFFQHHHIYDAGSWQLLVEAAGYEVVQCKALGSPTINRVFESQLGPAFFEFLYKALFKQYPSSHPFRSLPPEEFFRQLSVQPVELDSQGIVEYALEARVRP
jgi:SAM-dependent methyltransferase